MAARVVAGPPAMAQDVSRTLKDLVVRGLEPRLLGSYVADKRREGSEAREAPRKWDMRRRRGGLDDLDAMVRILQLRHGSDHPGVLTPSIAGALAGFSDVGLLDDALVRDLLGVRHLLRQIENVLAIAVDDRLDVDDATQELKANLSRAAGLESFDRLETALNDRFELVQTTYRELVGNSGATAR
jgi:glutamine synthetase adenylyltransferase